jgi:hypothetical protein
VHARDEARTRARNLHPLYDKLPTEVHQNDRKNVALIYPQPLTDQLRHLILIMNTHICSQI